jgi:hypothetical protein
MSNLLVLRPGLLPVVHWISVLLEDIITHGIPSMVTVFSDETVEKPVPVNVTGVFPVTVPYLGLIAVSNGVRDPK